MTISIGDITSGSIAGTGDFDVLVRAAKEHLLGEYTAGRITGDSYAQAYIAIVNQVLAQAMQFRLGAEQLSIQSKLSDEQLKLVTAQTAQVTADTLNIPKQGLLLDSQLIQSQKQTAQIEAQTTRLAAETLNVPKQGVLFDKQADQVTAQTDNVKAETVNVPKQGIMLDKQAINLDKQLEQITAAIALTTQKTSTEKAQILDTVDGAAVTGTVGKQKAVYDAQIKGFKDDALQKATKLMQDLWSVQRSTDSGVKPSDEAMNQDIDIGNATKTLFTSLGIPTS